MRGYKLSKDYKLLKELLDKGYKIIMVQHTNYGLPLLSVSHYHAESKRYYLAGLHIWSEEDGRFGTFEEYCNDWGIEFIEPPEEE